MKMLPYSTPEMASNPPTIDFTLAETARALSTVLPSHELDSYTKAVNTLQLSSPDSAISQASAQSTTDGFQAFMLSRRDPLFHGMTITLELNQQAGDQITVASRLLSRVATIAADPHTHLSTADGKSLDRSQADAFLATTRQVGKTIDTLLSTPSSRHVVCWVEGQAFALDILDESHIPKSAAIIHSALADIKAQAETKTAAPESIASLSWNLSRPDWFNVRQTIEAGDETSFVTIDTALATIALEPFAAPTERLEAIRTGAGSINRYADQVVGLVVFNDGVAGLSIDHASVDGGIAVQFANKLSTLDTPSTPTGAITPTRIAITLPPQLPQHDTPKSITRSSRTISLSETLPAHAAARISVANLVPFLTHMAVQAALRSIEDVIAKPLVTQSVTMRHLPGGRSDPSYPVTDASVALIDALTSSDTSGAGHGLELVGLLSNALTSHKNVIKTAKLGSSVGPHRSAIRAAISQSEKFKSLPETQVVLNAWDHFLGSKGGLVNVTGFDGAVGVQNAISNLYAENQMVCWYTSKFELKPEVSLSIAGSGLFQQADVLDRFVSATRTAFAALTKIATNYVLISDMFVDEDLVQSRQDVLSFQASAQVSKPAYAVALHSGAAETFAVDDILVSNVEVTLRAALEATERSLQRGGTAIEVAELGVRLLENCELYNAGRGAVFNVDGKHELEASLVDGRNRRAGAVACLTRTKNPIRSARLLLDKGAHPLLAGQAADELAEHNCLPIVENSHFATSARRAVWEAQKKKAAFDSEVDLHPQTVGAVVLDTYGDLAAAASTGGVLNKGIGRIGDVAIPGAGLYADKKVAVACSGDGDIFLRHSSASTIAQAYAAGHSLDAALQAELDSLSKQNSAQGGVIAVNQLGQVSIKASSQIFFVAASGPTQSPLATVRLSSSAPLTQNVFLEGRIIAGLAHAPSARGQATVTWPQNGGETLFNLPADRFARTLEETRSVANVLAEQQKVTRVALVSDGSSSLHLVPIHGVGNAKKIVHEEEQFDVTFKGYVHSKNGPRASSADLDAVRAKIVSVSGLPDAYSKVFDGPESDDSLFAKVIRGEVEQWRIWEDEKHVAFLTPFPNTIGFTVLVPRKHLNSNIFALDSADYLALNLAAHKVAQVLKKAFSTQHVAIIVEGFEIDYAHVKLIPRPTASAFPDLHEVSFFEKYPGYVTSQRGPRVSSSSLAADVATLRSKFSEMQLSSVKAPQTWLEPETHHIAAISQEWYGHVFQIQNTLFHETVKLFGTQLQYKYALVPVTTDCISSPMGLGSDSLPVQVELFNNNTYLADSMQFTLEYMLRFEEGLAGAYYIANSFRGEDPDSSHLNQFYHVECELLGGVDDAMRTAEQYVYGLTEAMYKNHAGIIKSIAGTTDHIKKVLDLFRANGGALPRITTDDAIAIFPSDDCWELAVEGSPELGRKVTRKGERWLIEHFGGACWLTEFDHLSCPFYQQYTDETKQKARCADMLIGLGETLGLGERHETAEEVLAALEHHTVPPESYQWYLDIRKARPLRTAGWGMGTERYLAWIFQHLDIRDFALIPRLKGKIFLP